MTFRTLLICATALLLSACFPAKEITAANAEQIPAAGRHLENVSDRASAGLKARISNQSLERFLVRNTASPVYGDCHDEKGTFLFSLSADNSAISMVFDECAGDDGSVLNGTVNGRFTETDGVIRMAMTGDLVARDGGDTINFAPIELTMDLVLTDHEIAAYLSHSGTYHYDTDAFKGTLTVDTIKPVGFSMATMTYSGHVTYTDSANHVLSVKRDNNGVHLTYDNLFLTAYTHAQWERND